ncbi:MAG TPA: IS1595 family transposase [Caulobacteraceae bacterium]|nr:IS1595 family transposase [Caulobacteraceae bacterium]
MAQHFLLSTKARTLSLAKVLRLSDDEAWETFKAIRWASTEGEPVCPRCGGLQIWNLNDNRRFKCKACGHKFSVTSGTIFASRKLPIRDYLAAIAIFVNGAKGHAALHLSRDLDVQYKTAFVMAHKMREAMASEQNAIGEVAGSVEIDGAYFGGYLKPANRREDRKDRRRRVYQTGKREVVVVMRERDGRTLPFVAKTEAAGVPVVANAIRAGSTVYADEASHWDQLEARFLTKRINHSVEYWTPEASTNMAESFFSRLRRAEVGVHHHIAGPYLAAYASEMSWREDRRRISNGEQFLAATAAALGHPVSRQWKGYWQRSAA